MPSRQPHGLTDPAASRHDGGERLAFARLRYPRRAIVCSSARGTELRVLAPPGAELELRTARPLRRGSVLLLLFREGQTLLARVADAAGEEGGSWKIRCRVVGGVDVPCAVQSA